MIILNPHCKALLHVPQPFKNGKPNCYFQTPVTFKALIVTFKFVSILWGLCFFEGYIIRP